MNAHDSPPAEALLRHEAFHVPLAGLFADLELGFGTVALTDDVCDLASARRQRILRDWALAMKVEADRALVDMFRDFSSRHADRSIVQQVDHFKKSCKAEDIHCPSDFALLLQQY